YRPLVLPGTGATLTAGPNLHAGASRAAGAVDQAFTCVERARLRVLEGLRAGRGTGGYRRRVGSVNRSLPPPALGHQREAPRCGRNGMPDVYAAIAEVEVATQERLAAILELRAAAPQQRAMLDSYLSEVGFSPAARVLEV